MKNRRNKFFYLTIILFSISCLLIIKNINALFFSKDNKNQIFTIGNVKQQIIQENFNSEDFKNILPEENIVKDPKIKNTGGNDQYVFVDVLVPMKNVATFNESKSKNNKQLIDLFTFTKNSNWNIIKDYTENSFHHYVFVYGNANKPLVLKANETTNTIFDTVKYAPVVQGEIKVDEDVSIILKSYGIQADEKIIENKNSLEVFNIAING